MTTKNTRRFEFKMGRLGLVFFLLGLSGMLFGVFLLGVTVGQNIDTYPEKITRYLPDKIRILMRLPGETPETARALHEPVKPEKPGPQVGLSDHERFVKGKQNNLSSPPAPAAPQTPPVPAPAAESPASGSEKPPVREEFLVQVASYQEKGKAKRLAEAISAMGYATRTEVVELPGKGKWVRVVMGNFPSRLEAQKAADAVSAKHKGLHCVIRAVAGMER